MNKVLELQKKTKEANKRLVERWSPILNHKAMPSIKDEYTAINTARILENMARYLKETTFSGDVAQFTPILIPMVRRMLPGLIANELLGMQPMSGPVGYVFGLRYGYAGENKEDPNMHSHYVDQGRVFSVRKSDPRRNIVGVMSGTLAVTGTSVINQYEGKAIESELAKHQPYGFSGHNISVGDVLVAMKDVAGGGVGPDQYTTSSFAGTETIVGAWKVITILDSATHWNFLTVAYPVGTLEQSETWQKRFKLANSPDYDKQRNSDYKNGFFRRAIQGELNEFKDDTGVWLFWCRTAVDPFRIVQTDGSYQKSMGPYDIYAKTLSVQDLRMIPGRNGANTPQYGAFTRITNAGLSHLSNGSGYAGAQSGNNGIRLIDYQHPAEVGYNKIYSDYAGPYETHRGEMLGVNRERRALGLHVEKQQIEARTRWLEASYSIEAEQDLRAMHNIDLNGEYMNALGYEMQQEIDRECMERLFYLAEINRTDTLEKSYVNITASNMAQYLKAGTSPGADRLVDTYRRLLNLMLRMSNGIGKDTMRGSANFAVVSPSIAVMLESMQNFNMTNIEGDVDSNEFSVGLIGTINGNMKIYKDLLTNRDKDFILLGYKGDGNYDAGAFYCPYVPLQVEQTVGEKTFERTIGFQTRYDIADNIFGAEHYYRLIEIDQDVVATL